jgi:hypothetical protein
MFEFRRTADNADEFERVQFVCKARSNGKESAYRVGSSFTEYVHVEWTRTGSRLVASDGRRLHVTEVKERIPRGDYKPEVSKDRINFGDPIPGIQFPNWKTVVPEPVIEKGTLSLERAGVSKNLKLAEGMSIAFNDFVQKTGVVVNMRFLDDLPKRDWKVKVHKDRKSVVMLEQRNAPKPTYAVFAPLKEAA